MIGGRTNGNLCKCKSQTLGNGNYGLECNCLSHSCEAGYYKKRIKTRKRGEDEEEKRGKERRGKERRREERLGEERRKEKRRGEKRRGETNEGRTERRSGRMKTNGIEVRT